MVLIHKKLGRITMCSLHNGGHLRVCAIEKSKKYTKKIGGLNNKTAKKSKLPQ